ncbi:unnamed protein product [Sphagnum jensenii]|uniref:Uncharacterized protein n=1 Tax=Sphagnum jensenii TaxID=128206 RepID=A0ABP0ZWZ9_9BRYO
MKSMKVKPECINSVQVVQADGKVISICMDPTKQIDFSLCQNSKFGSCRVKNRQDGPMSIAVNLSPSNHVPVHAAFNTVADRKEANIIQRAKDKLAWKICYNPQGQNRLGQNVLVEMNGGTLQDRLGDPDSSTCVPNLTIVVLFPPTLYRYCLNSNITTVKSIVDSFVFESRRKDTMYVAGRLK